ASGAWSDFKSINGGSEPTGALTVPKTYSLKCTGSGGMSMLQTVTITVTAGTPTIIEIPPR
ncbi:MAG: hypothetical protein Q8Q94_00670, partial [bacterium]|nr:hypothetical protein [bacterium]